jgi:hypothetical protein
MKLNAAQIKAAEAGASPETIAALATDAPGAVPTTLVVPEASAVVTPAPVVTPASVVATVPAAAVVTTMEIAAHEGIVASLQTQITTANTSLISAQAKIQNLEASVAQTEPLLGIVREVLGNKLVAMGGSPDAAKTFNASNIVAEFQRVDTLFKATYKPNGVAKPAEVDPVSASTEVAAFAGTRNFYIPS